MDEPDSLVGPAPLFATAQFIPIASPAAFADSPVSRSYRDSHSFYFAPGPVAFERHGEQGLLLPPAYSYEQVQVQLAPPLLSPRSQLSDEEAIRQDPTLYRRELAVVVPGLQPAGVHQGDHHRESAQLHTAGGQYHSSFAGALAAGQVSGGAGGGEDHGAFVVSEGF